MNPKNRAALADRVAKAAEAALAERQFVSPIDVLVGIGWLDPGAVERWRRGRSIISKGSSRPTCRASRKPWIRRSCLPGASGPLSLAVTPNIQKPSIEW
jgi:hypothetical protein